MRALILLSIGLVVGAFCAFAAAGALNKRHAHARGVMVVLARHLDALQAAGGVACSAVDAQRHLQQIRFAAVEIDYAFAATRAHSPEFARRSAGFADAAGRAATPVADCRDLAQRVADLDRGCRECHKRFR